MKKAVIIICLLFGTSQITNAQIDFGVKAGVNYNSDSFENVKGDILSGAESKTGFHAGIWTRIKLPVLGLYIRPELIYTQLSNDVTYKPVVGGVIGINTINTTFDIQKIDLPVLVGAKIFNFVHVFGGPSFQYIINSEFDIDDLKEVNSDGFSLGIQFGAGIELGKIGLDVRWERALSDTEMEFVGNNSDGVTFDTRVNQIIVGLSYRF